MRWWLAAFALGLALAATAAPAFAENRVALVIGENAYEHVQPLLKAVGDAKGYAAALREKGYVVTEGYDVKTFELNAKVAAFIDAIQPGDTAVFVYSGHGWSDGARNYIIGTDAPATAGVAGRVSFVQAQTNARLRACQRLTQSPWTCDATFPHGPDRAVVG